MDEESKQVAEVQTVPLVVYDSAMAREHRLMRWLVVGWAVTALVLGAIIFCYANAEYEVVTDTTTTETTTTEQNADSGDNGNAIVGDGDITIGDSE